MSTKIDLIENSWFMIEYKNYWYVVHKYPLVMLKTWRDAFC